MASIGGLLSAGLSSKLGMTTRYARPLGAWWAAAVAAAVGYGVFLVVSVLRLPAGAVGWVYAASELLITAGLFFGRHLSDNGSR